MHMQMVMMAALTAALNAAAAELPEKKVLTLEAAKQVAAAAAAEALAAGSPASPVTYLDQATVDAAFSRGAPLLETPEYKVHASRRTEPGLIEVHEYETDVVYVLEGEASFVTGGRLLDGKVTAPGEIRGARIEGGSAQQLKPGDVVVVPRGTPHWFKEIQQAPFLYFVVKPIALPGGAS